MAITKIHPIKSTLNLAISYIVNGEKTDEQILVSTHKCHQETAHTQFLRTRNDAGTNGTVLARHLIQSFLPGETSPEMAHQIGLKPKDKQRFTRAKTIGEDYTEKRLKERITENQTIKTPPVKKRIGNVINMNTNAKVKESKEHSNIRILSSKLLKAKEQMKGQEEKKESVLGAIKKYQAEDKEKPKEKKEAAEKEAER